MWTSLRLRNFKAFEDSGEIELAPLTILIGPNSGGKSTILKAFLALRQTAEGRDPAIPLLHDGPYCSLGEYGDYVFRGEKHREVSLDLGLGVGMYLVHLGHDLEPASPPVETLPCHFSVTWGLDETGPTVVVARCAYALDGNRAILVVSHVEGGEYEVSWGKPHGPPLTARRSRDSLLRGFFVQGEALLGASHRHPEPQLADFGRALDNHVRGTWYLGPLRKDPKRYYEVSQERPSDVGLAGERAADVLYASGNEDKSLQQDVGEWAERLGIARNLRIEELKGKLIYITVDGPSGHTSNVVDVGFGVSQVFPVLVEGLYAPKGSTLLLEQPEIHLNPRIQAALGDFLVEVVNNRGKQLIVETHSEHLLSRVRTRVARGELDPAKLAVHYCYVTPEGGVVQKLPVTENGQFEQWPEGFFEEEIDEALALTHAVFERHNNAGAKSS